MTVGWLRIRCSVAEDEDAGLVGGEIEREIAGGRREWTSPVSGSHCSPSRCVVAKVAVA